VVRLVRLVRVVVPPVMDSYHLVDERYISISKYKKAFAPCLLIHVHVKTKKIYVH
jgi:hypothetical protein